MNLISIGTIYLLGISNLIFLVLVLFSCRCFMGIRLYLKLLEKPWFKKFYSRHQPGVASIDFEEERPTTGSTGNQKIMIKWNHVQRTP